MKLIDKADVVAEIKRMKDEYLKHCKNKFHAAWSCGTLDNILSFLDKLEVKEVDLEKEIDDYMAKEWEGIEEDKHFYDMIKNDLSDIAKHFFELGLSSNSAVE